MKYNLKLFDNITIENKKELVLKWCFRRKNTWFP